MRKKALVVGLGQFGGALARTLSARGVDVLAVDSDVARVRALEPHVALARCLDATDEEAIGQTSPERHDFCVCAIGDEGREGAIICTALLRQLGGRHVVARTTDPLQERILRLVGAHEVVNPEAAFGERLASHLMYSGIVDEVPLGSALVITELVPPAAFVGRSLAELALPRRHQLTVVAVRKGGGDAVSMPVPTEPLAADDVLVVVAPPGSVAKLLERMT